MGGQASELLTRGGAGCRPLDPHRPNLSRLHHSMSTEFSDAALQEAEAAIKTSQAYQPSKGEKVFNKIGESWAYV